MKKRTIIDIYGRAKKIGCISCEINCGQIESPGGFIARTKYFSAGQDYEIPIPGFIILSIKRHLTSIDEFTQAELIDFIQFLYKIRKAIKIVLNVPVCFILEEDTSSSHFHLWIFPRYKWMKKKFGKNLESITPIMEYARTYLKTSKNFDSIDKTTKKLRRQLEKI